MSNNCNSITISDCTPTHQCNNGCVEIIDTNCIKYFGNNLNFCGTTINKNDNLTQIIQKLLSSVCNNQNYILKEDFLAKMDYDLEINFNPIFDLFFTDYSINTKTISTIDPNHTGTLCFNITGSSNGYQVGGIFTRDQSYIIGDKFNILEIKNFSIKNTTNNPIIKDSINGVFFTMGFINGAGTHDTNYNNAIYLDINLIENNKFTIKISQNVNGVKTFSNSTSINIEENYSFKLVIDDGKAMLFINDLFKAELLINPALKTLPMSLHILASASGNVLDAYIDALYYNKQQ